MPKSNIIKALEELDKKDIEEDLIVRFYITPEEN